MRVKEEGGGGWGATSTFSQSTQIKGLMIVYVSDEKCKVISCVSYKWFPRPPVYCGIDSFERVFTDGTVFLKLDVACIMYMYFPCSET